MKLKVGIIGCGGIAQTKHLPALVSRDDIEIVAFCDILSKPLNEAVEKFGNKNSKTFSDYKELLKIDEIDIVHVLTPNRSHSEITVNALNAKKHVMCEKPMAINYKEAMKMVEAAKKNGKLLTVGYQNRYRGDSIYLKKECERDTFGEIYYARAKAIRRRAVPTWGVFLNEYEQGGGPLIDIGTHALDLTLFMMNNYKPKYVVGTTYHKLNNQTDQGNAFGPWNPKEFSVEDSAFGFVVMENNATIFLESSWALNALDAIEAATALCGTKGGADMFDGLRLNGVEHDRQFVKKVDFSKGGVAFFEGKSADAKDIELDVFIKAVKGEGELCVLPEQAAIVTRILDAIYESAKTGKPVYFND